MLESLNTTTNIPFMQVSLMLYSYHKDVIYIPFINV